MKIDDNIKSAVGLSNTTAPTKSVKNQEKIAVTSSVETSVHVNSTMLAITPASSSSSFDTQKVERIKAAIANGTFKVDLEKVADGLISSVEDSLKSTKRQ